jgi:hypothetical protein
MSQNTIYSGVNKGVYEAFECFAEATHTTEIKVGQQSTIWLLLCKEYVTDSQIREVLMHK